MSKVRLGDVAIEVRETSKNPEGLPVVGLEHLISGEITLTQWSEASDNTFTKLFHKGQILFGRRRAYLKKAAVAPFDGVCSGDITVISAKPEKLLPDLLPFIISNDAFFDYAMEKSAGSLSPRVKWAQLAEYEFDLPELAEQQTLANLLWAMERTRKAYQDLLAQTDELVKSQFVEMFGDPIDNTLSWPTQHLRELTSKIRSGATPKGGNASYKDHGISLIRSMHVYNGFFDYEDLAYIDEDQAKKLESVEVLNEDVLLNITGASVARCCIVPENVLPARVNQHVCIIRCLKDMVLPIFINQLLIGPAYQSKLWDMAEAAGATRQALTKEQVENLAVIVPPMDLQRQFSDFICQADKSKLAIRQALESLEKSRSAIMTKVFG